jgi:hypothetical protein
MIWTPKEWPIMAHFYNCRSPGQAGAGTILPIRQLKWFPYRRTDYQTYPLDKTEILSSALKKIHFTLEKG